MTGLTRTFNSIQKYLFPILEEEIGELTEKQCQFVKIVELIEPQRFMLKFCWCGFGRPSNDRTSILKAFIAKAVYNFPTTKVLIDQIQSSPALRRLCGWEIRSEIPSESTFSRGFKEFSDSNLAEEIHQAIVKENLGKKLVGHISRDSTSIVGREKAEPKNELIKKVKHKRGRPKKGEKREKKERRLELQPNQSLEENLSGLPTGCNYGTKKNSKGKKVTWCGFKFHIDCADGEIPVSATLTSASVHDSQVAIPQAQKTAVCVTSLYDLMDAAYDAPEIREFSKQLGHVPIIDYNKRNGIKPEFTPSEKIRYRERSTAERVNADLKDNFGGRTVRVKGNKKVFTHLMFGIIAITVKQLFNMLC